ncbi:hypothetical protein HT031_005630 [Scenedesmus sp. PABB004]|nr:hypothetical protein HT031_005630 [Scenedesmus sp. PABB004]
MGWRGGSSTLGVLVVLALAWRADAGGALLTPSDINTCTNSTTDSAPQISRVQSCASASVVGSGMGSALSFASAQAGVLRAAAEACGDAVAGSIGELCAGGDPMASIVASAKACSTALAALYAKTVTASGVLELGPAAVDAPATPAGRLQACGAGCANSQGAAEAFAQAAACGVGKATDACIAATAHVKSRAFSSAFVKSTAAAWGKACTAGGLVHSGGETIARTMAESAARALAQVAASACAECPTCKCKELPLSWDWNNAGGFSDAAAGVAAGRIGLARALAGATTTYCHSNGTVEAVKDASAEVLADAAASVFADWCPSAAARLADVQLLTNETISKLVEKAAQRCTQDDGSGQAADVAVLLLTGNQPFVEKLADALKEAKACGCLGAKCLWMRALALLCLLGLGAAHAQLFNPFAFMQGQAPSFTVTYDSETGDQTNDACTRAGEPRGARPECDAFTPPQIAKVHACSRSKAVSANGAGLSTSFTNSTFSLRNQATTACAEAVGNAVKGLCAGGDPLATITSIASTCASALVEFQASSISGVEITPATDVPLLSPERKAFTLACADGCGNAETTAEAVAQSSACSWMSATKGCNAVRVALTSQNYAQAFISTTAASWSNACAMGFGKSTSTGTAAAKSTADVLSKAFGEVVAAACSGCDTCRCKPLPPGWSYDKSDDISKAAATAVAGQFTMSKAISSAVGAYCESDKSPLAIQAGVNATINTMAVILANVMAATTSSASATGAAMACGGGSVSQQVKASKVAFINALTDASAVVFDHQCAAAHSRMKGLTNALSDSVDEAFETVVSRCAAANGSLTPVTVNATDEVKRVLTHTEPVVVAIGEALQDAVSCGCKPGNCFWCVANDANKTAHGSAVSAFDLGNNVTGQFKSPLNWNQMAAAAAGKDWLSADGAAEEEQDPVLRGGGAPPAGGAAGAGDAAAGGSGGGEASSGSGGEPSTAGSGASGADADGSSGGAAAAGDSSASTGGGGSS